MIYGYPQSRKPPYPCVGVLLAPFSDAMIFQETVEPGNCIVYFLAKTAGHGHSMNYFDVEIAMII